MRVAESSILLRKYNPYSVYVVQAGAKQLCEVVEKGSDVSEVEVGDIVSFTPKKFIEVHRDNETFILTSKYYVTHEANNT